MEIKGGVYVEIKRVCYVVCVGGDGEVDVSSS